MSDLLFISDLSQLEFVRKTILKKNSFIHVVTSNMRVASELEKHNISFSDELSYIEPDEIAHNLKLSYKLTDDWWDEQRAETEFLGIKLSKAAGQEWAMPFELCLNAKIAYQRLIVAESPSKIYSFLMPPIAMSRTGPAPAFRPAASITRAVLSWVAKDAGIPIIDLKRKFPLRSMGTQWKPRLTYDDMNNAKVNSMDEGYRFNSDKDEQLVFIWKDGLWPHEIHEIAQGFGSRSSWRVITLGARDLELSETINQKREYVRIGQKLDHAWQVYKSSLIGYSGKYPEIFGNPYLEFQFLRIFSEMRLAAHLCLSFSKLMDTLQPSLIIFGHEAFTIERTFVQVARRKGIPTVGLIHGGLQPKYGRLGIVGDADHIMVWGENDEQDLTAAGVQKSRLCRVGSLRYDKLYKGITVKTSTECSPEQKIQIRRQLNLPLRSPLVLLLTTPTNIELSQPCANPMQYRKSWRDILELATRRPDLTFAIKPHPAYDFIDYYRHLSSRGPSNFILLGPCLLEDVLKISDISVLVNYCTTAALESMLSRVPVIFLRSAIYTTEMHKDPLEKHGAVSVSSGKELEAVMDRLLNDISFRQETLNDAQTLMQLLLGDPKQPSLIQMMDALQRIALPKTGGCVPAKNKQDTSLHLQISSIIRSIGCSDRKDQQLRTINRLVDIITSQVNQHIDMEDVICDSAIIMGYTIRNPKVLLKVVPVYFSELSNALGMSAGTRKRLLLQAYLISMNRCVESGSMQIARILALHALWHAPGYAFKTSILWYLFIRSMATNRTMLFFINSVDRIRYHITKAT